MAAAAIAVAGRPNIALAAFATDGIDGPTNAAGAVVTRTVHVGMGLQQRAELVVGLQHLLGKEAAALEGGVVDRRGVAL